MVHDMTEKQYPYVVYHLDRERLDALEKQPCSNQEKVWFDQYLAMLSNAPRIEDDQLEEYKLAASKERMKRKCESCKALMAAGLYQKVCSIDSKTAVDAIEMTNDINEVWYRKKRKGVVVHTEHPRSTTNYDVIERFGRAFLCMPLGFIDIEEQVYASGIV